MNKPINDRLAVTVAIMQHELSIQTLKKLQAQTINAKLILSDNDNELIFRPQLLPFSLPDFIRDVVLETAIAVHEIHVKELQELLKQTPGEYGQ